MDRDRTPPQPRLVRRYGNRKLYDTVAGRYVTRDTRARLASAGHELLVLDHDTGEDLTNATLAQVLLEQMRGGASRIPRQVLTQLIRLAHGPSSAWTHWPEPQALAGRARAEVEKVVSRLLGPGRLGLDDAVALRHELGQLVHRLVAEAQSGAQTSLRALVAKGEGVAGRSLAALKGRLERLEGYLEPDVRRTAPRRRRSRRAPVPGRKR